MRNPTECNVCGLLPMDDLYINFLGRKKNYKDVRGQEVLLYTLWPQLKGHRMKQLDESVVFQGMPSTRDLQICSKGLDYVEKCVKLA